MELSLDRLTKQYGRKIAVDCVSATLKPGVYGLLGANGAGKTTLMRMLCAVLESTSGEVLLDGTDITAVPPRERCGSMGFVMQNPESQFTTFTVEEELAFGMENLCTPVPEMEERIKEALKFVGMEGYEKIDLNQLHLLRQRSFYGILTRIIELTI